MTLVSVASFAKPIWSAFVTLLDPRHDERLTDKLVRQFGEFEEQQYRSLILRYPLGYVLWAEGHNTVALPPVAVGLSGFELDAESGGLSAIDANAVTLRVPTIVERQTGSKLAHTDVVLGREVGRERVVATFKTFVVLAEILKDDRAGIAAVIGFRATRDPLREP